MTPLTVTAQLQAGVAHAGPWGIALDGLLAGVVHAQRKAELLRAIAEQEGISLEQVIAVGDGANDLPMLSIAGLGIAFRAKPLVKETAKQAISTLGLDGILYLIGVRDRDQAELLSAGLAARENLTAD